MIKLLKQPKKVKITTIDQNELNCILSEINGDLSLVNVIELETPIGIYEQAQLRMSDIAFISFD
jgi:hypothetical protein